MTDTLTRIDHTLNNLCPCGADPRPGSAYCSEDCTPTHRTRDTTADYDGTAMRWCPDLVTATDNTGLTPITHFRHGSGHRTFNATVFEHDGTDRLHLRLDDGHRFVGCDTDGHQVAAEEGLTPLWGRLERELTDPHRVVPDDPWADTHPARPTPAEQQQIAAWLRENGIDPTRPLPDGNHIHVHLSTGRAAGPVGNHYPHHAVRAVNITNPVTYRDMERMRAQLSRAFRSAGDAMTALRNGIRASARAVGGFVPPAPPEPQEPHPMLQAIERRRTNTNTGPQPRRQRPPRALPPR